MEKSDKVLRKMGEVLAFAKFGDDTFIKGKNALSKLFGSKVLEELMQTNNSHNEVLYSIAEEVEGGIDVMCDKSIKTFKKFELMREVYLVDQWDDATEILEWMSFFEGGAIVHWALVEGLASNAKHTKLVELATYAKNFHRELLSLVETSITENKK